MSDYETKPPERMIRWKLAPVKGEWELTFRVTLPNEDDEDTREQDQK